MSERNTDAADHSRRSVLKTSAAALAGSAALPATTVARSDNESKKIEKLHRASLKILENEGPEAQAAFLEKHDVPHAHQKTAYVMDPVEAREDDVSSESHFHDGGCIEPENCDYDPDLECSISISYDMYNGKYFVELAARYRYRYWYDDICWRGSDRGWTMDGPRSPMDGFGLIWNENHWELADTDYPARSTYSSSNVDWDNGSSLGEGAAYRADDRQQCYDSGVTESEPYDDTCGDEEGDEEMAWSDWLYGGAEVRYGSEHEDGDEIQGKYVYQYNENDDNFSVGVSYPWGVSISWSSSTTVKQKSTQTEPDGRNMTVTASDAH